jgi:hypothetical protein
MEDHLQEEDLLDFLDINLNILRIPQLSIFVVFHDKDQLFSF